MKIARYFLFPFSLFASSWFVAVGWTVQVHHTGGPLATQASSDATLEHGSSNQQCYVKPINKQHMSSELRHIASFGHEEVSISDSTTTKPKKEIRTITRTETVIYGGDGGQHNLILYDDPFNSRQHVQNTLKSVIGLSDDKAHAVMMTAHTSGQAVVGTWILELAEIFASKLSAAGLMVEVTPEK
jgi:ATP-dependent Clp protease adapter protein ClpS